MNIHTIKLNEQFCDDVMEGLKTFEIRLNDRNYQVGDIIHFKPVTNDGNEYYHKIVNRVYQITYIISGWGLQNGYVAFSIKEIQCDPLEDYV